MSSTRLPLVCAFAVGCLSSAALLGMWRADSQALARTQQPRARHAQVVTASVVVPNAPQRGDVSPEAKRGSSSAPEPAHVENLEQASELKASQDPASGSPSPGGSAVSDVLMDLEAAYRQRLIAAARAEAEAAPERQTAPASMPAAPAEHPPAAAALAVAPVAALAPAVAAPPAAPPAAPTPVASEPQAPSAPAVVAQNDARPADVHIGDVNQNTYITNVRQGDVYVIQQQLAMLQYMQVMGSSANPGVTQPGYVARGAAQRQPPFRQFPSTLTNLDNPWGFNFSPPNLVH